ncbi:unnamed protein product [Discula destructiva]
MYHHIAKLWLASSWLAFAAKASTGPDGQPLQVHTTSGELQGFINATAPAVRQFLGVPYAQPPLGSLRFQPPQRKNDSGPVNAAEYAPSCMQMNSTAPSVYTEYMREFLINGGQSEDCLYLNVYVPDEPTDEKLPVFIYIPGGGFTSGGADALYKISRTNGFKRRSLTLLLP